MDFLIEVATALAVAAVFEFGRRFFAALWSPPPKPRFWEVRRRADDQ